MSKVGDWMVARYGTGYAIKRWVGPNEAEFHGGAKKSGELFPIQIPNVIYDSFEKTLDRVRELNNEMGSP